MAAALVVPAGDPAGTGVYFLLGLNNPREEVALGTPKVLSVLSLVLQRVAGDNEQLMETTEMEDTMITIFHAVRAPSMSIQQYMDRIFRFYNNAYYAKVGGVSTAEMNKMEIDLLFGLDFRLQVKQGTFKHYCLQLAKEGNKV